MEKTVRNYTAFCGITVGPPGGTRLLAGIPRAPPAGLWPASGALGIPLVAPFYDRALKKIENGKMEKWKTVRNYIAF